MSLPEIDIRMDPNLTQSLIAIVLLIADEGKYGFELQGEWLGHLREGKLHVSFPKKWLVREWSHWQENPDMCIVLYSLLRAKGCFDIRNLRHDADPDLDYAVFKFEVVT
jgi:hypothetical protein